GRQGNNDSVRRNVRAPVSGRVASPLARVQPGERNISVSRAVGPVSPRGDGHVQEREGGTGLTNGTQKGERGGIGVVGAGSSPPPPVDRPRLRTPGARCLGALYREIALAKQRFGLP